MRARSWGGLLLMSLASCQDVPIGGPMDRVSDEPLPALDAAGFLGFRHLERSDLAVTLLLEPDAGAALWMTQCDSIGLGGGTWVQRSANTAEMNRSVLTLLDDGRLLASPPLFPAVSPSVETWVQGAVCDVCLPGQPIAVVRCASPDAGAPGCCAAPRNAHLAGSRGVKKKGRRAMTPS